MPIIARFIVITMTLLVALIIVLFMLMCAAAVIDIEQPLVAMVRQSSMYVSVLMTGVVALMWTSILTWAAPLKFRPVLLLTWSSLLVVYGLTVLFNMVFKEESIFLSAVGVLVGGLLVSALVTTAFHVNTRFLKKEATHH